MAKSIREQIATINASIEKLTARRTELEGKVGSEVDYAAVQPGATVTFNYGRGEKVRVLTGKVVGRKDTPEGQKGGDLVKVQVGNGFDSDIVTIFPQQVTSIEAAAQNGGNGLDVPEEPVISDNGVVLGEEGNILSDPQ